MAKYNKIPLPTALSQLAHTHAHTCARACTHAHEHTHVCTHAHTCTRTHMHTHTHIYTHKLFFLFLSVQLCSRDVLSLMHTHVCIFIFVLTTLLFISCPEPIPFVSFSNFIFYLINRRKVLQISVCWARGEEGVPHSGLHVRVQAEVN